MKQTYLFAGASSLVAYQSLLLLKAQGHKVIGLSTKPAIYDYDEFYQIEKYEIDFFPIINEAIDGLVYFSGTINLKPFHRFTPKEFIIDYEINTLGAAYLAQYYLPNLKQSNNSSIVFFSSVAAQNGMPFHASIAMAKAALEGLTRALAAELAPAIRVNCIAPSLTKTPLADRFINTLEKEEVSAKRNPMKKIGDPKDLANAVLFLLSNQSSWVTGQIIAIDGGMGTLKL